MHICIVEPHDGIREMERDALRLAGHTTTSTNDTEACLRSGFIRDADLLLIEPGRDMTDEQLFDIVHMARATIIITSFDRIEHLALVNHIPCLPKPFSVQMFFDAINKVTKFDEIEERHGEAMLN